MFARSLRHAAALLLLACTSVSVPLSAGADRSDRIFRALLIPSTTPLTLRATVGEISVIGWDQPRVSIEVTSRAPSREQPTLLDVEVESRDGHASVTALQVPDSKDPALTSSIIVHAPVDQVFGDVELFEGRITLKNLRGGVRARVEHGSIDAVSLAAPVRLETVVGDIRLDRADLADVGGIRLRTFNGDVTLGFTSPPADARILALSLGGLVSSDLPLTLRTAFGPRFGELTLGPGSRMVSIDVVRGNIRITSGGQ